MPDDRFKSLGSILARTLGESVELAGEIARLERLRALWPDLLPSAAGRHSLPQHLTGHRLLVEADSPAWADRLRRQQRALLAQLRAHPDAAGITELRIKVRPRNQPPPQNGKQEAYPAASRRPGAAWSGQKPVRDD